MANNVAVTPGSGLTFKTTDNAGVHTTHHNIDSHPPVTNAGTFVTQENGAALTALQLIDDAIVALAAAIAGAKGMLAAGTDGTNARALAVTTAGLLKVDDGGGSISIDDNAGTLTVDDGGLTLSIDDGAGSITVDGTVGISGTVPVSGPVTDTQIRATPLPVSGTVGISGTVPVSGPATDVQLRATPLPVSGTVGVSGTVPVSGNVGITGTVPVSGPLTDTALRATPVPVSGPVTDAQIRATALPVSGPLTDTQIRATALPVSGPATDAQLRATALQVRSAASILDLSASFTRPSDTNVYAINDLLGINTSANSGNAIAVASAVFANGDGFRIERLRLFKSTNVLTLASFRIHLWRDLPTFTAIGDNGAQGLITALVVDSLQHHIEYFDVTMDIAGSTTGAGASGIGAPARSVPVIVRPNTGTTFYYSVQALGAYVPASAEVFTCFLEGVRA